MSLPDLSLTTLTWINAGLLLLYLPMGFMGWAFAGGAAANADAGPAVQRKILAIALSPVVALVLLLGLPYALEAPWSVRVAWAPSVVVALGIALLFVASALAGFVQGLRGEPRSSEDDSGDAPA